MIDKFVIYKDGSILNARDYNTEAEAIAVLIRYCDLARENGARVFCPADSRAFVNWQDGTPVEVIYIAPRHVPPAPRALIN